MNGERTFHRADLMLVFAFFCFLFVSCLTESAEERLVLDDPQNFSQCTFGSGNFGRWIVDRFGLPAYEYTLRHEDDDIALWWNSEGKERREHWHQVGNSRISAMAYNEGYVQLFTQEGGFKWINLYDEEDLNFAGGFSYVYDGEELWATSYRHRPTGARTTRIFGINYFFSETEHRGISVERYVWAPLDDLPMIITDVIVRNRDGKTKDITYYEYWDVNFHYLLTEMVTSGLLDRKIPAGIRDKRKRYNERFLQRAFTSEETAFIRTRPRHVADARGVSSLLEEPTEYDRTPPYVFLTYLDGWNDRRSVENVGYIFEQKVVFSGGDPKRPDLVDASTSRDTKELAGLGQPLAMIHKRRFRLPPEGSVRFRYAYGYTWVVEPFEIPPKYSEPNAFEREMEILKGKLAYFVTPGRCHIQREITWHSYYMLSSSYYRRHLGLHVVSQGGSYLFMHGYDGAPRDYCIFSVALNQISPQLSKEILKFIMMTTTEDGEIPYANYGDVIPLRTDLVRPSDLDIFFLWAVGEYLLSTRDFDFLSESLPFYGSGQAQTVLRRLELAFRHLFDVIGTGANGMIKVRTGDWSDGIRFFADDIMSFEREGESVFNTAFAAAILPKVAEAIREADAELSGEMKRASETLRSSLERAWNGRWYIRGTEGTGKLIGNERLFLEPQVWAIIGGVADPPRAKLIISSLVENLETELGAVIVHPPSEKVERITGLSAGTDINGGIWHAVNSLLTWAYSLYDQDLAWRSFEKNTLANHAHLYPNIWYGIWSGPDSYNAPWSERPGEAAAHYITSLADFPVVNANAHAGPILSLVKLAGVNFGREEIEISPKIRDDFELRFPHIGVRYAGDVVEGYYRSSGDGRIRMKVKVKREPREVKVDGRTVEFVRTKDGMVVFDVELLAGRLIRWRIL